MHTAAALLFYLIFIILHAWRDSKEIAHGIWPDHFGGAVAAILFAILLAFACLGLRFTTLAFVLLLLSLRWIVFDLALNFIRGLPLSYIGLPDKNDAFLDTLLLEEPGLQYILKGALLLFAVFLFMRSYRR
ncbi:MAG: hypothetical protein M3Q97_06105 [Bacteroidota bacterium]|nr:hypothetical protein [Bacteroidota bacterium]